MPSSSIVIANEIDRLSPTQRPTDQPVIMRQEWKSLLFLHWSVDPEIIQQRLPKGLFVDTYDGSAYLGVVPFYMHALRPVFAPAVPGISFFPELNLRTYVYDKAGRPGVWFFSLDAHTRISVWIARTFFNLNYQYARMSYREHEDSSFTITCKRGSSQDQNFCYNPEEKIGHALPGSIEHFLVERYYLFNQANDGSIGIGRIHHAPYEIYEPKVAHYDVTLFPLNGFPRPQKTFDHALFSPGVDVSVFPIKKA
ncbi:MAG: DUF2071 domain-containing protein [Verrucomicrobiota bacterium]